MVLYGQDCRKFVKRVNKINLFIVDTRSIIGFKQTLREISDLFLIDVVQQLTCSYYCRSIFNAIFYIYTQYLNMFPCFTTVVCT